MVFKGRLEYMVKSRDFHLKHADSIFCFILGFFLSFFFVSISSLTRSNYRYKFRLVDKHSSQSTADDRHIETMCFHSSL